jgi:hypothetical protein
MACKQSNSTCTCIPGGDKDLLLQFSDGTSQRVTLAADTSMQFFELAPVITTYVSIRVMSVYSNPLTCPPRSECQWWDPMCNNWCPNGISHLELITTESWEEVYDWNLGYMLNYSVRAALVSRSASISLRQYDRDVTVFQSDTPVMYNATVLNHAHINSSSMNQQALVTCRSWDYTLSRWSPRGVIHSGRMWNEAGLYISYATNRDSGIYKRVVAANSSANARVVNVTGSSRARDVESTLFLPGAVHTCESFFAGDFALVLREDPIRVPYHNVSSVLLATLNMTPYFDFSVFFFFFAVLCVYAVMSVLSLARWLEDWRVEKMAQLQRHREYLMQVGGDPCIYTCMFSCIYSYVRVCTYGARAHMYIK